MPWAGNYDLIQIAVGATVLFPAQVPGGLFSLGDLHAAMGEHEATFVAIECAGSATVRLDMRPGMALETPRIETADRDPVEAPSVGRSLDGVTDALVAKPSVDDYLPGAPLRIAGQAIDEVCGRTVVPECGRAGEEPSPIGARR